MNNPPLTVAAIIKAKAGCEEKLKRALLELVDPTRAEFGCLQYDLHQGQDDRGLFIFYENWTDRQALEAHFESTHLKAMQEKASAWLAEPVQIHLMTGLNPSKKILEKQKQGGN
jgi:quinol monooxygenase YgiN